MNMDPIETIEHHYKRVPKLIRFVLHIPITVIFFTVAIPIVIFISYPVLAIRKLWRGFK